MHLVENEDHTHWLDAMSPEETEGGAPATFHVTVPRLGIDLAGLAKFGHRDIRKSWSGQRQETLNQVAAARYASVF
jgi:chorismate synthase